jgi:hypothetical protein
MPVKFSIPSGVLIFSGAAAALALALFAAGVRADETNGMEALDFKVQLENFPPPNETQVKTLLEGARARPLPEGMILLTDAKLRTYNTNGALEMLAQAPQCIFDSVQHTVSSTGYLYIQTINGKFSLEGEGFLLQTNSDLIVSNLVRTAVQNTNTTAKSRKP